MSGFLTQTGIVIGPLSDVLNISVTQTATIFSFLTGGTFIGTLASMWAFSRYSIPHIFRTAYILLITLLAILLLATINSSAILSYLLLVLGVCCGVGLSGGAVIVSTIYTDDQKRAIAFLGTDCSFSLAGYVFPRIAATLVAAGFAWSYGYSIVGVLAIIILFSTWLMYFPMTVIEDNKTTYAANIWTPRVLIIALALCMYLVSQTTFLTWAPQYLETRFLLTPLEASKAVSNYWGPSIFGLLGAAFLITKIPTRIFLIFVSSIAVLISWLMFTTKEPDTFLQLTGSLGLLTSCIFKVGISVGTQQIPKSPPILVTFLLCSATFGSTIAPALSSVIVNIYSVSAAIQLSAIGFTLVAILFSICLILEKRALS